MPPKTARYADLELSSVGVSAPNGTFEKVALQLTDEKSKTGQHHPLVFFMPAEGTSRLYYSLIASTISSNGYTVVTIDTPYDVDIVEYTDGSVIFLNRTIAQTSNETVLLENAILAVQTRAQDVSFVIDSLSNVTFTRNLVPSLSTGGLNTSHVAMFGHSLGGAATLAALQSDARIVGGLNMDGTFFGPSTQQGTNKPFMIMAHGNHTRVNSDILNSWAEAWPNLRGWKRDVMVADTLHYDFSDYPILFETLGTTPGKKIADQILVGSMKGTRALKVVTVYVSAFLDFVLLGKHSSLLDGPVDAFPEITFEF